MATLLVDGLEANRIGRVGVGWEVTNLPNNLLLSKNDSLRASDAAFRGLGAYFDGKDIEDHHNSGSKRSYLS